MKIPQVECIVLSLPLRLKAMNSVFSLEFEAEDDVVSKYYHIKPFASTWDRVLKKDRPALGRRELPNHLFRSQLKDRNLFFPSLDLPPLKFAVLVCSGK